MVSQEEDGVSAGVGDLVEEEAADGVRDCCGPRKAERPLLWDLGTFGGIFHPSPRPRKEKHFKGPTERRKKEENNAGGQK